MESAAIPVPFHARSTSLGTQNVQLIPSLHTAPLASITHLPAADSCPQRQEGPSERPLVDVTMCGTKSARPTQPPLLSWDGICWELKDHSGCLLHELLVQAGKGCAPCTALHPHPSPRLCQHPHQRVCVPPKLVKGSSSRERHRQQPYRTLPVCLTLLC